MSTSVGLTGHFHKDRPSYWTVEINGVPWRTPARRIRRFKSRESASNAAKRHLGLALEPRP